MLFCCCFCRAAAVSPKKVEEDNISSWRPQQTQTEQVNSIRKPLSRRGAEAEARRSNGGRSGKAADAHRCSAAYYLTG